jgi:hypothetical protein
MKRIGRIGRVGLVGLAGLLLCGCTTATRTVTGSGGTTQSTKVSTFLTTVQGFDDSVSPDGTSHTIIANYASDVQAMQVLAGAILQAMKVTAIAGNTNLVNNTNFATLLAPK